MANNQIKVNLSFSADTSKARQSMKELQSQLNGFINTLNQQAIDSGMTDSIRAATSETIKLQSALSSAFNANTGKLDLSKFQQQLKASGTDLTTLQKKLSAAGIEGQKTFLGLAQQIMQAEMPTKRLSQTIEKFGKTLKDTARWQISSSIIHGLQGGLQSAYGYAQDLNRSLNDIRIVTGYDVEYMSRFADEANRAAQALSTTTNEYAKASLIYFQQGLSDEAVSQRTATTIKLANTTGRSAEEVSSYMTAVWNNFDDGTRSLEFYADAIAKLGAETAASSEEIATGLQKFSAVANTVGLSYEYATAALATVTSQTRESAETVGTAFKTIFARLESLSLGETLDDDTNMTKYSQALAQVGVNIKNASGGLKDMDTIIDELGSKWNNINKDQQIALAQTVAGMRQYNNFIALMDNYDTFSVNVNLAANATGELDKQADIYAESWEAARDRVTAATESIFKKLIDDEFFVDLLNDLEKVISFVDLLVDSFGGLRGVLSIVSSMLLQVAGPHIAKGLENMVFNLKGLVGINAKEAMSTKAKVADLAERTIDEQSRSRGGEWDRKQDAEMTIMKDQLMLQADIQDNESKLTDEVKERLGYYQQILRVLGEQKVQSAEELTAAQEARSAAEDEYKIAARDAGSTIFTAAVAATGDGASGSLSPEDTKKLWDEENEAILNTIGGEDRYMEAMDTYIAELEEGTITWDQFHKKVSDLYDEYAEYGETIAGEIENAEKMGPHGGDARRKYRAKDDADALAQLKTKASTRNKEAIKKEAKDMRQTRIDRQKKTEGLFVEGDIEPNEQAEAYEKGIKKVIEAREKEIEVTDRAANTNKVYSSTVEEAGEVIQQNVNSPLKWSQSLVLAAQGISSTLAGLSSLSAAWATLNNPDMSGWEKVTSIFMSLTTALPMLIGGMEALNKSQIISNTIAVAKNGLLTSTLGLTLKESLALKGKDDIEKQQILTGKLKLTNDQAQLVISKLKEGASLREALASIRNTAAKGAEAGAVGAKTGADAAETTGMWAKVAAYIAAQAAAWPVLVVTLAIVAAMAALVAIIALVVMAFKNAEANSPEGQLRAAKEEASAFAEALEEAKERANELKQAFDEYETILQKLAECVKGTEEWTAALNENNAKVIELMQKYPELASMVNEVGETAIIKDSKTGALKIADWAIQDLELQANNSVIASQTASFAANSNVRNKQLIIQQENLKEDILDSIIKREVAATQDSSGYSTSTDLTSSYIEKIVENANLFTGKTQESINSILKDELKFDVADDIMADWSRAIYENTGGFEDLRKAIEANTQATQIEVEAIKQQLLVDNQVISSSKYSNQIIAAVNVTGENKTLDARIEEIKNVLNSYTGENGTKNAGWGKSGISQTDDVNNEAEKIFREYAEAAGITGATLVDTTGNDNNREFVYEIWDAEQKKYIEKSIDLASMIQTRASYLANQEITEEAEALTELYNSMDAGQAALLTAATAGDTSFMSRADIASYITRNADGSITANVDDAVASLDLDTDELAVLGYESLEQFKNDLKESVEQGESAWAKMTSFMANRTEEALNGLIERQSDNESFKKLTDEQLNQYGTALDTLYKNNGAAAQDSFNSIMDTLLKENEAEADKIVQIASGIDWTNGEQGLVDLQNQLYDAGVYIDENSQQWKDFVDEIESTPTSLLTYDFEKIREEIATIQELVQDISFGDVITDDEFNTLKKYSSEVKDLFILTADGYRFIGDETKLQEVSLENSRKLLQESLNDSKEAQQAAATFSGWVQGEQRDFEYLSSTKDKSAVTRRAESFLAYDGLVTEDLLSQVGFKGGRNYLEELFKKAKDDTDLAVQNDAIQELQELYGNIAKLQDKVAAGDFATQKDFELYASQFDTWAELEEKYEEYLKEKGLWDTPEAQGAYKKQVDYINNQIELLTKAIDIYQDEENTIAGITKQLEAQEEITERLYGKGKIEAIEKEIELEKDLKKANQDAARVARAEQGKAIKELQKAGYKIERDEFGNVLNWEELEAQAIKNEGNNEAFNELKQNYLDATNQVETYTEAVEESTERIQESYKAQREEMLNMIETFGKVNELEIGETISEEQYKLLISTNQSLRDAYAFDGSDYVQVRELTDNEQVRLQKEAFNTAFKEYNRTRSTDLLSAAVSQHVGSLEELESLESLGIILPEKVYQQAEQNLIHLHETYLEGLDPLAEYKAATASLDEQLSRGLTGQARLNVLNNLAETYGQAKDIAANEVIEGQEELANLLADSGIQIEYDSFGNILNQNEIKVWASRSGKVEEAEKLLDNYNESVETAIEYENNHINSLIEAAIYMAEYNQEIRDLELEWLDYQLSNIADDAFSSAQSIALLGQQLSLSQETINDASTSLNNLANKFNISARAANESMSDFMARVMSEAPMAAEEVKNIANTYFSEMQNIQKLDQTLADSLVKHFENVAEFYDDSLEKYELLTSTLSHYKNIVDIVGKDALGVNNDILDQLTQAEATAANTQLQISKKKYDQLKQDREEAERQLANAAEGSLNATYWAEQLKTLQDMENDALQKMNDNWATALEAAAAVLENNTTRIMESFEKSMSGLYGSFDRMQEAFDQQSELNAQYLADYKKVYELSKLTRNIQNQIDNTDSIAAKRTLRELQEEITELQESGTEMSEYDLEYLQKKYDLRVAEIALEEAQNAKSQVRLQKMSDGSWGYIYTQNAEAVENAQQNYEDKLYAMQELSTSHLEEISQQILQIQQDFNEAYSRIINDQTLSDAERQEEINKLVNFYTERFNFLGEEFDKVIMNNQGVANLAQSLSETTLGALYPDGAYDSAKDIVSAWVEKVGSWEEEESLLGQTANALGQFKNSVTDIFEYAGADVTKFGDVVQATVEDVGNQAKNTLDQIASFEANPEVTALDNLIQTVKNKRDELIEQYQIIANDYASFVGANFGTQIKFSDLSSSEIEEQLLSWKVITDEQYKALQNQKVPEFKTGILASLWGAAKAQGHPAAFQTGGYTGDWGPNGKFALLHEKEIVLNAQDTANLLKVMELMDNIIKTIDIESAAAASARSLTAATITSTGDTLQQEVTIHAEFPHATNRDEIEAAFETLVNRAAQYSNRKR